MALTRANLRKLTTGRHSDSGQNGVRGLYLEVKETGRRSFLGITKIGGVRHAFGLGSLDDTGLDLARERWVQIRQRLRDGETVEQIRGKGGAEHTFGRIAERAYDARRGRMRDGKADQWMRSLEMHMGPLMDRPIGQLTAPILLAHLSPLVKAKPETASKVIGRVAITFKYAMALGLVNFDPAPAVKSAAPWPRKKVKHHAAVTIEDAPRVFQRIAASTSVSAAALVVTILTGARSGTIRNMQADQIDGDTFHAAADQMKSGKAYDYPLTPIAKGLVEHWAGYRGDVVFCNSKGRELSDMALLKVSKPDSTVHGWRSTLVDWLREVEQIDDEMIDAVLAHSAEEKERPMRGPICSNAEGVC